MKVLVRSFCYNNYTKRELEQQQAPPGTYSCTGADLIAHEAPPFMARHPVWSVKSALWSIIQGPGSLRRASHASQQGHRMKCYASCARKSAPVKLRPLRVANEQDMGGAFQDDHRDMPYHDRACAVALSGRPLWSPWLWSPFLVVALELGSLRIYCFSVQ